MSQEIVKKGWLVNDCLSCIPGSKTLWHYLLYEIDGLEDKTDGYTDYSILAQKIENQYNSLEIKPDYIIRNGSYFKKLNINIPTFCLIQDTQNNEMQTEVINSCDVVVFPSKFTYNAYKDRISPKNVQIIQNGADFNFFRPISEKHPDVLPNSILFIGDSSIEKKGFHLVLDIINKMPELNFCLIMKDDTNINNIPYENRSRVRIFNKIPMEIVRLIINSCICAICTSGNEEEHIAGIEIGACNIPMVARPVSRYFDDRNDIEWGLIANDNEFPQKIRFVLENKHLFSPRNYYFTKYSKEVNIKKWAKIVKDFV
jgi:glycosyltransferase involved in cell wall biosynthesis